MVECPECGSIELTEGDVDYGERQDDEHSVTVTPYECKKCGCAFEHVIRTEIEDEVVTHGKEHVSEDDEDAN